MFESFFPRPKLFFLTFLGWALACVLFWYFAALNLGSALSPGVLFGFEFPLPLPPDAAPDAVAAFEAAREGPQTFWSYCYLLFCYGVFVGAWMRFSPHPWQRWSVAGSALIIFVTWFQVQLDVMINEWFGSFYDLIQQALGEPNSVTWEEYLAQLVEFGGIAMVYITVAVLAAFFTSHYVFRWRTAMSDRYTAMWPRIRHIEGASQRVQEDTMRFAAIMEGLGSRFIDSIMTLIAFLPILWGLSEFVSVLPIIGEVPQALVFVAILWSVVGTALLALAGIRLPGLEFRNQRVEAAFRKELVLGEDDARAAQPPTLGTLFSNVRRNYFTLYLNYLYFNVARYGYLQAGVLVPYLALGPTIVSGTITLGVMQQIIRAFGRVENSFQFLVNSWTTIVELMSIYKRLAAFEAEIEGRRLAEIESEGETTPT